MFLQPDNLTLWDDARSDLPYVLCLVFGGLDLCCFLLMCFDKWCSKEGRDPFTNLMWLMDLRATQRGSSKGDDDAPGSSAVRSDQAAVLGGVLRSGPWKDLQAPQNYAGPHQAIFHVSNMSDCLLCFLFGSCDHWMQTYVPNDDSAKVWWTVVIQQQLLSFPSTKVQACLAQFTQVTFIVIKVWRDTLPDTKTLCVM